MSQNPHYKWLIVVEGNSDAGTLRHLLVEYGVSKHDFFLFPAGGKPNVLHTKQWPHIKIDNSGLDLASVVINDIGRKTFVGAILVVDSDTDANDPFGQYDRDQGLLQYVHHTPNKHKIVDSYWLLDELKGSRDIPILGINVPLNNKGCIETDLLDTYGFPKNGQPEHQSFFDIIIKATDKWNIQKLKSGIDWWAENQEAKIDKFIYSALTHGFQVCKQKPRLPAEPQMITQIKTAMEYKKS
jgi:hypothetical protein